MSLFEDLKSEWQDQAKREPSGVKGAESIREKVAWLRAKNRIALFILTLTLVLVGIFFIRVGAIGAPGYGLPVSLMLGGVFVRVLAELWWGQYNLKGISPALSALEYNRKLMHYYRQRLWVHYGLTPLSFVAYIAGFLLLLPTFKATLSSGLYTYILISGPMILIAILWLVIVQIRKELRLLKSLGREE